jgi:hypothetical protein
VAAQSEKVPVAVFPFTCTQADLRVRATQIHEMVVEVMRERSNIDLIDRAKDSFLTKELDYQIREQSMAAPGLVAQGKLSGAKQLIVGTLTNIALETSNSNPNSYVGQKTASVPVYTATVSFSLQLCDVESGRVISHRDFSNKDVKKGILGAIGISANAVATTSKEDAIVNGMTACKKPVQSWLNEVYPSIRLEKVEDRDTHGNPKTILISGLDPSLSKGTVVTVFEVEEFKGEGDKTFTRTREVSKLKVTEMQGEIAVCKVTSGETVIEGKMKPGSKLQFKIR